MKTWKKVLLALVVLGTIAGGSFYYYAKVYSIKKPLDIASKKSIVVSADELLNSYSIDSAKWTKTYKNQALEIAGIVKEFTVTDSISTLVLAGMDSTSTATISCVLQKLQPVLKNGDKATIKGICEDVDGQGLFGTSVKLNEAIVVKH